MRAMAMRAGVLLMVGATAACTASSAEDEGQADESAAQSQDAISAPSACRTVAKLLEGATIDVAFDASTHVAWSIRADSTSCKKVAGRGDYEATMSGTLTQRSVGAPRELGAFYGLSRSFPVTIASPISSFDSASPSFTVAPDAGAQTSAGLRDVDQRYFRVKVERAETAGAPRTARIDDVRLYTTDGAGSHDVVVVPPATAAQRAQCALLRQVLSSRFEKGSDLSWSFTATEAECTQRRGRSSYELVLRATLGQRSQLDASDGVGAFLQGNRSLPSLVSTSRDPYDASQLSFTIAPSPAAQQASGVRDLDQRYFDVRIDRNQASKATVAELRYFTRDTVATHPMEVVFAL